MRLARRLLPLTLAIPACTTYRPAPVPAPNTAQEYEFPVRATLRDGQDVRLFRARVLGDSLLGLNRGGEATTVPLQSVASLTVARPDNARTAVVVATVSAVAAAAYYVLMVGHTDQLVYAPNFNRSAVRHP